MSRKDRLARAEAEHGSAFIVVNFARMLRMAASEEDAREAALAAVRQEHNHPHLHRKGPVTTEALNDVRVLRVPFNTWVYPSKDGELIYGRERLLIDGQEGTVWRRIGGPIADDDRTEVRRQAAVNALDRRAEGPRSLPLAKVASEALAATGSWVWTERPFGPLWGWRVAVFPTGEAAIAHTRPTQPIWGLRNDGAANQIDGGDSAPMLRDGYGLAVR